MKLTAILLTAACLNLSARVISQQVNFSGKNASLKEVFSAVEKQTGYLFFYTDALLKNAKPVTIEANDLPVKEFLQLVFKNQPLDFVMENNAVIISTRPIAPLSAGQGQHPPTAGVVRGADGKPLAGATVRVKGRATTVVTDEKGIFQLTVDEGATLVISYVGFNETEVKVGEDRFITITLEPVEEVLEMAEIVSTGYQTINRERNAGSIAKVDMSKVANRSSSMNILQRLDGLVPGVVVNNTPSGEPLLIRGLTSLNSTRSPLIVVDGVELPSNQTTDESRSNIFNSANPIANINPQDIADISILRDASAASIWGAKAANGVIVITTKRGRTSDRLRIEYDGFYNFQGKPERDYIPKMNSRQFITTAEELFPQYAPFNPLEAVETLNPIAPHLIIQYNREKGLITPEQATKSLDSLASIDNRGEIMDLYYRNAATTNHTVAISGGSRLYNFYGSLAYTGLQNSTPGERNNSYKVNLRQDFNVSKRIQISLITDLTNTNISGSNLSVDPAFSNLNNPSAAGISDPGTSFVPYQKFRDANGNPLPVNFLGLYAEPRRLDFAARSRINLDYSPLDEFNRGSVKSNNLSGRVVGGAKINLFKGLRFEGTYGYQTFSRSDRTMLTQDNYGVRSLLVSFTQAPDINSTPRYWLPKDGGRLILNNSSQKNWTVRNQLMFDKSINDHELTLMVGQEATSVTPIATSATYYGWDDQLQLSRPVNIDTLMRGITGTVPGNPRTLEDNNVRGGEGAIARTASYYSTLNYAFQRKYALNASWRIDESNLFGLAKSAQNRPVYSIGGKWMMNRETFMTPVNWLDKLDIRITYGITGNAPLPAQAASFDILQADANVNYVTGVGLIVRTPGNDKLTWEGTKVYNAGIDFSLFGGRLGGSLDGYLKKTTDLIGSLLTAPLTGYPSVTGNYGDLENKGIELSLTSINHKSVNFFWSTTVNAAFNKNKITRLAAESAITTGTGIIIAMNERPFFEGYPAYANFTFNYAGLNEFGDPQIIQADGKLLSTRNGSKVEDMLFRGQSQPLWTGGLFNTVQYKDFQLGINISFNVGHRLFRDVNTYWSEPFFNNSAHPEFLNRWKQAGDEDITNIPRFAFNSDISDDRNTLYYQYASLNLFNASYAKIREITFAYSLPQRLVNAVKAEGLTLRAQVSNLMLWRANNLGIDPEFHSALGGRSIRTGQGTFTIGAHLTF